MIAFYAELGFSTTPTSSQLEARGLAGEESRWAAIELVGNSDSTSATMSDPPIASLEQLLFHFALNVDTAMDTVVRA